MGSGALRGTMGRGHGEIQWEGGMEGHSGKGHRGVQWEGEGGAP